MRIPTESCGSVPRPKYLQDAGVDLQAGRLSQEKYDALLDKAVRETIEELEKTGSYMISDGEQAKASFITYPLVGLSNVSPSVPTVGALSINPEDEGFGIRFADGHTRQLPTLTGSPFRYSVYSGAYVNHARKYTKLPIIQAVISPSAMSILYPEAGVEGYSREQFIEDAISECTKDIRSSLDAGAEVVQIDFTEGRLACKVDPSRALLKQFVNLNNAVLDRFSASERERIGVHVCPGGDQNSVHSADVDYAELLPDLFRIKAGRFYMQMASEVDKGRVLDIINRERQPYQTTFIGVINTCDPKVETPELVRDRTLEIAEYLKGERFGTTDDCGFSPFGDDIAMARSIAFAKIKARVEGTKLAAAKLA